MGRVSFWALAPALLLACGPKIDPLQDTREAYRDALQAPPEDLRHHAVVAASDATAGALLADLAVGAPVTAPGPFGMKLVLLPTVSRASASGDGRDPLQFHAELAGTTDIVFPLLSADDLAWEATVDAPIASWTNERADGLEVGVQWADRDQVRVDLHLPAAPEQAAALAQGAVQGAVTAVLDEGLGFVLPRTPWGAVRDVRIAGTGEGLVAELVLSGVGGDPPPLSGIPAEGVVAAVSDDTILGIAKAIAVEQQAVDDTYVVEPIDVRCTDHEVVVDLRLHRRGRRAKFRTYRLAAPLRWDGEAISWPVVEFELLGHERWRGGWRTNIGENRAKALLDGAIAEVPTTLATSVGKRRMVLNLQDLTVVEGGLELVGAVEVESVDEGP